MLTQPHLQIEPQSASSCSLAEATPLTSCTASHVTVNAGDVLPLLLDAQLANRAWIEDFADEPLQITQDLYEVLLAYRRFRLEAA